jgi:hypothetical protein
LPFSLRKYFEWLIIYSGSPWTKLKNDINLFDFKNVISKQNKKTRDFDIETIFEWTVIVVIFNYCWHSLSFRRKSQTFES